jgi:opacity protein-like surface antigen
MPDLPILRGAVSEGLTSSRVNWQGFYIGGQVGYGVANMNFFGANDKLALGIEPTLGVSPSQYPALGKTAPTGSAFGGFAGYNWQWDDVVIGLDGSYLHGSFTGSSTGRDLFLGSLNGANFYTSSSASANVHDFGSLRARAGYAVGSFLPYMTAGVGLGSADIIRKINVYDTVFGGQLPTTSALGDHFVYGYSAGFGVDVMLIGCVFLRAEYEYQRIASPVDINMNTVRAGLGYKF